jgi:ABC-2 type transport system ATP-binding protein
VGTYSSGMVKKLSLVLAFIGRPALIALDEPLVTLDADSVPILYDLIAKTYHEQQTGFLISSHQELSASALPWEKTLLVKDQSLQIIA